MAARLLNTLGRLGIGIAVAGGVINSAGVAGAPYNLKLSPIQPNFLAVVVRFHEKLTCVKF